LIEEIDWEKGTAMDLKEKKRRDDVADIL